MALTLVGFAAAYFSWGLGLTEALIPAIVVFIGRLAWASYARSTVNRYRRK
jgi:hypothetical protein